MKMLRAEENKMATHGTVFLAFVALLAFLAYLVFSAFSAVQWVKDLVLSPHTV
jgi:hypothetical protein